MWKKQITLFLLSQNLSLFGSAVVAFAILWHITLQTSSGMWMMLYTVCAALPQVIISPFSGVWADRYSRKRLIMLSDAFTALATLGLAVSFMLGFQRLELLLIAGVARSFGQGIQTPAVGAIFPQLVPQEHLTKMQGINQTLMSVLMLLAPAAGGVLLGTVGIVWAFWVDVVTATLAILVMSRIRVAKIAPADTAVSMWQDIKAGISYTFSHRQLRRLMLCCLFSFFLITPAAVLTPLMIERTFGPEVWRLTANEIVWTGGSILGGVLVSLKGRFDNKVRVIGFSMVWFGVMFALLGASWDFISYLAFMGLGGCFLPVLVTTQTVYVQEITAPEVLGRVFSVIQLITASAMPVAILFFGPLADVVSVQSILLVSGALLALVGIWYGRGEKVRAAQTHI